MSIFRQIGIKMGYRFELITGPMSCGKTEELLRRIRRLIIAKKNVKVISPAIDTREKGAFIKSRNGLSLDTIKVKNSFAILDEIEEKEGGIYAEINLEKEYEFRDKCTVLKDIQDSYEVIKK